MLRKVVSLVLCTGILTATLATQSRVETIGKHDAFYMDDVSIFRNPANISIYPNMLLGSYGVYKTVEEDTAGDYAALNRNNRDPEDPFFGAILTYSLNKSAEGGNQYPMLSFGAVFNRKDDKLMYLDPASYGDTTSKYEFEEPKGKIDLLFSYAFPNGGMVGVGAYLAFQKKESGSRIFQSNYLRGSVGANWPIARSMDLEGSLNIGALTFIGYDTTGTNNTKTIFSENDIFVEADLRLFSALSLLNGDFVPHARYSRLSLYQGDDIFWDITGGFGLNINIDKGFFWAGIEGIYENKSRKIGDDTDAIGGRISFGIERNVVWDWFVVRVGGQKKLMYMKTNASDGEWVENPEGDGTKDDLVGLGIGLNVENRLKFDIVVSEDIIHTLTNLFSGPQHHIFTRIDATFSF